MYDAFLSYARQDDEPFVERLYRDLTARGLRLFWDRVSMPNRDLTFLQEIRDAVEASDRLIAVVGPQALRSAYVLAEWEHARVFAKDVVAVPRLAGYEQVPAGLAKYYGPDFQRDDQYPRALDQLDRLLREPTVPLGALRTAVPALPAYFLLRVEELEALHQLVLADIERPLALPPARRITSVVGMAGAGKSVIAAAFARAVATRRAFTKDGVVWLAVGREPAAAQLARLLGAAFDVDLGDEPAVAYGRLPRVLADRSVLLVLDDVWEIAHVERIVNAMGEGCRLLVTTRDGAVASGLGPNRLPVGTLADEAALRLLSAYGGVEDTALPDEAREVAGECGNLPFALALCGSMARDGIAWADMRDALRAADLGYVEAALPNYPFSDLLRAQHVSVERLDGEHPGAAERYLDLVVFPSARVVPESVVLALWSAAQVAERDGRKLLTTLERKHLLTLDGTAPHRKVGMHDLQRDYLQGSVANAAPRHATLVDVYAQRCGGEWSLGPDDGYFFAWLPWHLRQAGRGAAYEALLLDFDWLQAKLDRIGVAAVLADYSLEPDERSVIRLPEAALQMAAMVLTEDRSQWAGQLLGRLGSLRWPEELQPLLDGARRWRGRPWLRPLRAALNMPGSALHSTLVGHEGTPRSVAITPDGRWVASAGNSDPDWTLRVWNAATGVPIHVLPDRAEAGGFTPLALTPDGRALFSGAQAQILMWSVARGLLEASMAGHAAAVTALAVAEGSSRLVSGSSDGVVLLWNLVNRSSTSLARLEEPVHAVAISADGRCVSAATPVGLTWWDTSAGQTQTLGDATGFADSWRRPPLVLSSDGAHVIFGSPLHDWEPRTGRVVAVFESKLPGRVVALSGDGRVALVTPDEETLEIWDRGRGPRASLETQFAFVSCAALTTTGDRAIVGLYDHRLKVWDVGGCPPLGVKRSASPWPYVTRVTITDDERYAVVAWSNGQKWDCRIDDDHESEWDPERARIVAGAESRWQAEQRLLDAVVARPEMQAAAERGFSVAAVHPDVVLLTYRQRGKSGEWEEPDEPEAGLDGYQLGVWRPVSTSVEPTLLRGHSLPISAAAISPDGQRAISGSIGRTVRLWDLESERPLRIFRGHQGTVYGVAVAGKGRFAVSASADRTVRVWDLDGPANTPLAVFTGEVMMSACAITSDGRTVVAVERRGAVHVLRLEGAVGGGPGGPSGQPDTVG
jgi:WD40 repeat protein